MMMMMVMMMMMTTMKNTQVNIEHTEKDRQSGRQREGKRE